jgi:spore germination protein YaaH
MCCRLGLVIETRRSELTGTHFSVGPLYEVESGDTIMSVAATMKTTVKMLMTNNPQIAENGMMKPKQKICVLPCSAA